MDLHKFYKEHYFFEASRRHQLTTSALAIPIGILTVLGGALLVIIKEINAPFDNFEWVQIIFALLLSVVLGITAYYLIRSVFGYQYEYIATPKKLKQYYEGLLDYYKSKSDPKQDAQSELENFINSEYSECTHKNTTNNDTKSYYLHKANIFLITSLVFIVLAEFPHLIKSVIFAREAQKLEIVNNCPTTQRVKIMTEEKKPEPNKQQTVQTKPPSEKPTPPPRRIIRESVDPKKQK